MTKPLSKQLIRGACLLFTAMAFSSCSQTLVEKQEAVSALDSGRWRQVAKKPPTYYPKGVAEDHLTGASDGYWVYRGDKAGTRFFIPSHGVRGQSGDALIAEALAAATPERKKKI
ncbi:hypothetical protein SAMN02745181_0592 [Rubritalea squalenifaciens DSM 18772]|uniref:Uncharacterized protein n=1 Tax=Rubritalea squalenifaciens DSM 18772 TaxID=1123071 RepID=A0A1M6CXP5_9BACT|nr:hypothetical protein [Rubritalea squalenifaciens]SHI65621.1 hypothetical protein SAMN02745181_0592 [Rubritalea squalenifaciens DSM 18772]